jgi:uncharacterized protein (TIGR04222 family)
LLHRIQATPLVASYGPLDFESRLADEQRWTLGHATAVVAEYRRFLALTRLRAGTALAPPPDVDLAWRLHAAQSLEYARFCRDALDGAFVRRPSPGDAPDPARLRAQYAATLHAYRAAFGHGPPGQVWPTLEARTAVRERLRILPVHPWRVPEALATRPRRLAAAAIAAGLGLAVLWRLTGVLAGLHDLTVTLLVAGFAAGCGAAAWRARAAGAEAARPAARDTLDAHEAAWLAGGARRMAATAIVSLLGRGCLRLESLQETVQGGGYRPILHLQAGVTARAMPHPVERAILAAATNDRLRLAAARDAIDAMGQDIECRLVAAGLANDGASLQPSRAAALAGATLLLAIAASHGLWQLRADRPVGLAVALVIGLVVLVAWLARLESGPTARGRALLERLRLRVRHGRAAAARAFAREGGAAGNTVALPLAVALLGAVEVTGDERLDWLDYTPEPLGHHVRKDGADRSWGGGGGGSGWDWWDWSDGDWGWDVGGIADAISDCASD